MSYYIVLEHPQTSLFTPLTSNAWRVATDEYRWKYIEKYNIIFLLNRLVSTIFPQDSEYVRSKLLENVISQLEKDIVKSEMDGGKYDEAARYGPRMKTTEREPTGADYDDAASDGPNAVPSIRDNEYVQHGALWGAQYMSGTYNVSFSLYTVHYSWRLEIQKHRILDWRFTVFFYTYV